MGVNFTSRHVTAEWTGEIVGFRQRLTGLFVVFPNLIANVCLY